MSAARTTHEVQLCRELVDPMGQLRVLEYRGHASRQVGHVERDT
jgi:hypothetical protein